MVPSRRLLIWILGMVVLLAGLAAGWVLWPRQAPDPKAGNAEEVAKYISSKEFGEMPADQRRQYMDQVRQVERDSGQRLIDRDKLSDAQREQMRENMSGAFMAQMDQRIEAYFKLPEPEKVAYLDKILDEGQQRRAQVEARASTRPAGGGGQGSPAGGGDRGGARAGGGRRGPSAEGLRNRLEHSDPLKRAQHAEFRRALAERAKQRGITLPGPGGSGGRPPRGM